MQSVLCQGRHLALSLGHFIARRDDHVVAGF